MRHLAGALATGALLAAAGAAAADGFDRRGGYRASIRGTGGAPVRATPAPANRWDAEGWRYVDPAWWTRWYGSPAQPADGPHVRESLRGLDCTRRPTPGDAPALEQCGPAFFEPVYAGEVVRWYEVAPPAGLVREGLEAARTVRVGSRRYALEGHTFYRAETRDGRAVHVSVETPVGAELPAPPAHARPVEVDGETFHQYDSVFYRAEGAGPERRFVVVVPPPAP